MESFINSNKIISTFVKEMKILSDSINISNQNQFDTLYWRLLIFERVLNATIHLSRRPIGLRHPVGKLGVAGLIPAEDIRRTYILNFSFVSRPPHLGRAHANEIKHDHLPVVYVVLDPRHD